VIVVAPRAGSYEERTCSRCFEGRVYEKGNLQVVSNFHTKSATKPCLTSHPCFS
jgi:hypothetical protein